MSEFGSDKSLDNMLSTREMDDYIDNMYDDMRQDRTTEPLIKIGPPTFHRDDLEISAATGEIGEAEHKFDLGGAR